MKKRIISLLLCFCMTASLFSGVTISAFAVEGNEPAVEDVSSAFPFGEGGERSEPEEASESLPLEGKVDAAQPQTDEGESIPAVEDVQEICPVVSTPTDVVENVAPIETTPAEEVTAELQATYSGYCGSNLTWELSGRTLIISGTGAMYNYSTTSQKIFETTRYYSTAPWATYRDNYNLLNNRRIDKVILGQGITSIGNYAFYDCCYAMERIIIPDSVKRIGSYAFYGCDSLTDVVIPGTVESINSNAFSGCTALEHVYYAGTLEQWNYVDQSGSERLSSCLVLPNTRGIFASGSCGSQANWSLDSNYVLSIVGKGEISQAPGDASLRAIIRSLTISEDITSIASGVFSGCSSLESITIPFVGGSIKTESDTYQYPLGYIFGDGTAVNQNYHGSSTSSTTLGYYYIPSSLRSVTVTGGNILCGAFQNCSMLTSIILPEDITSIGSSAFSGCSGLTGITIPSGVTSIGSSAFSGCGSLTSITVSDGNTAYSSQDGVLFNKDKTTLIRCPGGKTGAYTIPDSVTAISDYAFSYCSSLTSVTIGKGVTSIGSQAFYGCSSLTSITLPEDITSIGSQAFYGCSGLTGITIPSGVTSIGSSAFFCCDSLTSVHITDLAAWCEISFGSYASNPLYYAGNLYLNGTLLTEAVIPAGVTEISDYAFSYYDSLTSVTIPDSVTSIGAYAFSYCSSLTSVTIPDSVTSIGAYAFSYCSSLTSVTIPDSVTNIDDYAFYNCSSLVNVTVGNGVTRIGDKAFSSCSRLNYNSYGNANYLGNSSNLYVALMNVARSSITSCLLNRNTKVIAAEAFDSCSSLTSVTIPDSVTSIGDSAFRSCYKLTSVTYCGTEEKWNEISIGDYNNYLENAVRTYHDWDEGEVTKQPTCEENGETTYVCKKYTSHRYTESIPALGHDMAVTQRVEPTREAEGLEVCVCSRCNKKQTNVLPKITWILGDATGDKAINAKDVTILRRYLASGYGIELVDEAVADVNKDSEYNAKDVTFLRRFLAGGYGVVLD